jgi:hypothetical protein
MLLSSQQVTEIMLLNSLHNIQGGNFRVPCVSITNLSIVTCSAWKLVKQKVVSRFPGACSVTQAQYPS